MTLSFGTDGVRGPVGEERRRTAVQEPGLITEGEPVRDLMRIHHGRVEVHLLLEHRREDRFQ